MAKIKKIILAALCFRVVLIFVSGYHPDILNHVDWGIKFWEYGSRNFYEQIFWGVSWPNQPPGTIYLFSLIAKIFQYLFSGIWFLNIKIPIFPSFVFPFLESKLHIILLKIPFILADLGIGWLLYRIVKALVGNERKAIFAAVIFLFNPALIYNSAVWGQTDSLINLLMIVGIYFAAKNKYLFSFIAIIGSLYLKLSLIIWIPAIIILFWFKRKDWRKIILNLLLGASLFVLISLPLVHHGNVFSWLWYVYTNRVLPRQGDMLVGNAFNLWGLLYGSELSIRESIVILGQSAKWWGFLLTILTWLTIFFVFLKNSKKSYYDLVWGVALLTFSAFLFMTNMHERYLYPIFAPLVILVAANKIDLKLYVAITLIHWLNLYNLWWYPEIGFIRTLLTRKEIFAVNILSLLSIATFVKLAMSYNGVNDSKIVAKKRDNL